MNDNAFIALGTAGERPSRLRGTGGGLLRIGDDLILVDPGEGAVRGMVQMGLRQSDLRHIHISHFHPDCCMGVPAILAGLGGTSIGISFPAAEQARFDSLVAAGVIGSPTIEVTPLASDAEAGPIQAGATRLSFAAMDHDVPCYGVRIEAENIVPVAYIPDTARCDAADSLAQGAGLCIARSRYLERHRAPADREKLMTALDVATMAAEANVEQLVLTGFSSRYELPNDFMHEARQVFSASTYAQDLSETPISHAAELAVA